ncbi:MAG TPA: sugar phosphate isomerase/epimerase family protein [Spirochaetales bacterium]|nr:sugar phosphate isomerase/epimerase family protein [Spirochaetales bacterium]
MDIKKGFSLILKNETQTSELLPYISDAGFEGIEPTFHTDFFPSPENYHREAPLLRSRCADLNLQVIGMRAGRITWSTIPSQDPRERQRALEHTKRALECVKLLGGDVLLVVPGEIHPSIPYKDHWKRVVEYGVKAGEAAREIGCVIGLENVEARFPLSVLEWQGLLQEINCPEVRMYLDVGNIAWLGLGFPQQWIRTLGDQIFRIHFKDALWGHEVRNLLEGDICWKEVIEALREIEYSGWISVEPEWYRWAPQRLTERLSRDLDAILAL